jgi:hypothetical protein
MNGASDVVVVVLPLVMPKRLPKTKLRPQPNVLFEATVRRMLATPPQPKKPAKKAARKARGATRRGKQSG